jgi:D-glycero-alpha-D-manno-heptose-7-phosphate kinase
MRISLGGGGTDLPSYYSRYGGFLVSAAINKYVYVNVNRRFEDSIRVSYSRTEIVDRVEDIQHPIVRQALQLLGLESGLEIVSIADAPANTGLGSSSSFTVGLLNALHAYKREHLAPQALAEEAYHIEVELLGEPIGKQDQYIGAIGGITCLDIGQDGTVRTSPLALTEHVMHELESNLVLFYTGIRRNASEVLGEQGQAVSDGEERVTEAMHTIKEIGKEIKAALEAGEVCRFGDLMHAHWAAKKRLSHKVSVDDIDHWYEIARKKGALGGKVMGAGGGGFFVFYCDNGETKFSVRRALTAEGLREMRFNIDFEGTKVMMNF